MTHHETSRNQTRDATNTALDAISYHDIVSILREKLTTENRVSAYDIKRAQSAVEFLANVLLPYENFHNDEKN